VLVAHIFAVPEETAVTRPDGLTVAMALLLEDHISTLLVAFDGIIVADI
jgi:hypothetical protein